MAAVRSTAALPAPGWAYLCLRLAVAALCLLVLCARPAQPLALRDDVHAVAGLRGEEGQQEERSGVEVQQGAPAASARMICVGEGCPARRDKQLCIQPVTVHSHVYMQSRWMCRAHHQRALSTGVHTAPRHAVYVTAGMSCAAEDGQPATPQPSATYATAPHLVHGHVAALAEQDLVGRLAVALATHRTHRVISIPAADAQQTRQRTRISTHLHSTALWVLW